MDKKFFVSLGMSRRYFYLCNNIYYFFYIMDVDEEFKDLRSKVIKPREATNDLLNRVHTEEYLTSLTVTIVFLLIYTKLLSAMKF